MSKLDRIGVNVVSDLMQLINIRKMHDEWMVLWSALDYEYLGDGNFVVDRSTESVNGFCWDGNETTIGKSLHGNVHCRHVRCTNYVARWCWTRGCTHDT